MIGFLTKWILGLSSPSPDASWRVLEELAVELYSSGPDHDELWTRAGGLAADLQKNGTGRARWHDALALIQRGKDPRPGRLLDEMSRDFPNNEHLRRLKSAGLFHAGHR
ncbi:effector-associated domain EAD1-containing protein [Termitidicoccus mucosus]|uniref:effector-associated domain EAD1-containing protein n=1 Tax=Termitidicoccus mucosus TaxID=1184151 RepID=UPI003CCBA034